MNELSPKLRIFLRGGFGYLAGAGIGLLVVILASWMGAGRWILSLIPEGQALVRLLGIILVTGTFLGLGGAFAGAAGGYFLADIMGLQKRNRMVWGGGIAYGLTTGLLLPVFLLLITFIAIYNNFNTNSINQFGILFGFFGLVYGLLAGLLQAFITLRLRYSWRVLLAAVPGYTLGFIILGLIVRWVNPTEAFRVAPILTLILLLAGLAAPFFLGGGLLGIVHGRLAQRERAVGAAIDDALPPHWQSITVSVAGLLLVVIVLGFLSDVTSFLKINPAPTQSQLYPETVGVGWSEPQPYTTGSGEFTPASDNAERTTVTGPDGVEHQAWCGEDGSIHYRSGSGPEEKIDLPNCQGETAVAISGDGTPHIVWYTQELVDTTGVSRPVNALVESIRQPEGWSEAAIAALTSGPVLFALYADDAGDLTLIWEENQARYFSRQKIYACSAESLSKPELAGYQSILEGNFRAGGLLVPYCRNQYERILYTPNPDPAFSDLPVSQNGAFDRVSALTDTARYEFLFTTMQWEPDDSPPSPGSVLVGQIAHLYQSVKANPERYPRGMTVRILLGNYPVVADFKWGEQIRDVIALLREAGIESMVDPEIGWRLEVANFAGTYPHAHTKFFVIDGKSVAAAGFNYGYLHFPKNHPSGRGYDLFDLALQVSGPVAQESIASYDDMWHGANQVTCEDFYPEDGSDWRDTCREIKAEVSHVPEVMRYYLPQEGNTNSFSLYRTAKNKEADTFIASSLSSANESIDMMQVNFSLEMICMVNVVLPGVCNFDNALPYMDALLFALEKNPVKLRVIMENTNSNGLENRVSGNVFLDELRRRGLEDQVDLRFYNGKIHAKSTLIDGELLIIGSMNMHYSSWGENGLNEYSLTTDDTQAIQEYQRLFETKWQEAIPFAEAQFGTSP